MRTTLGSALVLAVCLSPGLHGQDASSQLKDYSGVLKAEGLPLTLVHMTSKTVPLLFQPPTLYAMRARANQSLMFYVQGTPQKDVQLDTGAFVVEQNGQTISSTAINIKGFQKGKAPKGTQIDGLLVFEKQVDLSKAFSIVNGRDSVLFKFKAEQLKELAPPAPASR